MQSSNRSSNSCQALADARSKQRAMRTAERSEPCSVETSVVQLILLTSAKQRSRTRKMQRFMAWRRGRAGVRLEDNAQHEFWKFMPC